MRWKFLHRANAPYETEPDAQPDVWQRHVDKLRESGIPEPGSAVQGSKPATLADEQALYAVAPSVAAVGRVSARITVHAVGRRKLRCRLF